MKKYLSLLLIIIFTIGDITGATPKHHDRSHPATTVSYVYICNSTGAKVYHTSRDCSGLGHCTHQILKVTLNEAENTYHRRACKICAR
jgi:hypothetical protein